MKLSKLPPIGILCALAAGGPARDDEGVATGVGTRFSQTSTPLTNDQGTLEWVFTHRFNQNVKDAGGGSLGGLDSGAAIGFGVAYIFVPNVAVEVYRVNNYADYEFALKATLVRPHASFPLGLGVRGGLDWRTAAYAPSSANSSRRRTSCRTRWPSGRSRSRSRSSITGSPCGWGTPRRRPSTSTSAATTPAASRTGT